LAWRRSRDWSRSSLSQGRGLGIIRGERVNNWRCRDGPCWGQRDLKRVENINIVSATESISRDCKIRQVSDTSFHTPACICDALEKPVVVSILTFHPYFKAFRVVTERQASRWIFGIRDFRHQLHLEDERVESVIAIYCSEHHIVERMGCNREWSRDPDVGNGVRALLFKNVVRLNLVQE